MVLCLSSSAHGDHAAQAIFQAAWNTAVHRAQSPPVSAADSAAQQTSCQSFDLIRTSSAMFAMFWAGWKHGFRRVFGVRYITKIINVTVKNSHCMNHASISCDRRHGHSHSCLLNEIFDNKKCSKETN